MLIMIFFFFLMLPPSIFFEKKSFKQRLKLQRPKKQNVFWLTRAVSHVQLKQPSIATTVSKVSDLNCRDNQNVCHNTFNGYLVTLMAPVESHRKKLILIMAYDIQNVYTLYTYTILFIFYMLICCRLVCTMNWDIQQRGTNVHWSLTDWTNSTLLDILLLSVSFKTVM